ncbi:MAG TPA: hypothetical protein VHP35_07140, partial [Terriglobia bacterium]|nr:hypothetical protein [Terriglobia bacterium]
MRILAAQLLIAKERTQVSDVFEALVASSDQEHSRILATILGIVAWHLCFARPWQRHELYWQKGRFCWCSARIVLQTGIFAICCELLPSSGWYSSHRVLAS